MNTAPSEFFNTTIDHAQTITRRFGFCMCAVNLLLPLGVYIYAELTGQSYWRMFRSEDNFTAWFSSVQLLLISAIAYINYRLLILSNRSNLTVSQKYSWIWLVFALGFILFAIDERFNFHETLRDNLFVPVGLFTDIPYLIDGDIGLYLFYLIGLICTIFFYPELRNYRLSQFFFIAALTLTLPVIIIDSLTGNAMRHLPFWRFWDYVFEELGEVFAQLLFLLAFLNILYCRLNVWRDFPSSKEVFDRDER